MFVKMNAPLIAILSLISLTTALPGAPKETPPPSLAKRQAFAYHAERPRQATGAPSELTITVVNKMTTAISTAYAANPGVPSLAAGNQGAGTMSAGETASIIAPSGWAGNIGMVELPHSITGDVSLLEGSMMDQGNGYPVVDMDVSYV